MYVLFLSLPIPPLSPSQRSLSLDFCSASIGEISVWNSDEDIPLATLACGHMEAVGLQWSPAAGLLAGGSQSGCLNFFSVIESATEGKWTISLIAAVSTRSNSMVMSTAFSADGMRAAAGHTDGTVSIFDTETHSFVTTIRTPHDLPIRSLAFSVDGNTLVTGCEDSRVGLMAAAGSGSSSSNGGNGGGGGAGSSTTMIAAATNASLLSGHLAFITCVATSPIKNIIASSSADKTIRLWDTTNGEALFTLSVHGDKTNAVAFSPDGIKLASVSDAGTLAISNVNALKE